MIYSLPTRQLRELLNAQHELVWYDESEEWDGYHMERTVIPLDGGFTLSVIWGITYHHNIKLGIHYGYPDRLEGYIPGLGLDPVPLTPDEVLAAARAWPEYDWLAQ